LPIEPTIDPSAEPSCADCNVVFRKKGATACWSADPAAAPPRPGNCPTSHHGDLVGSAMEQYGPGGPDERLARVAAEVEGLCYEQQAGGTVHARWTRIEDTVALARRMGWKRIGIATCIGLLDETARLAEILEAQGLEPMSVCCKVGSVDKSALGIAEELKVRPGTFEPLCNPVAQARVLNRMGTDMNVIMGLCVGHDMLFVKHADAPTTTLVAKDRVTGHNPVAALYGNHFYYKRLAKQAISSPRDRSAGEGVQPEVPGKTG
jgi:uncharacterized metal-binding protein